MPARHPRPTAPLLLTLALCGCGPMDVDPDDALDAVVDATADALDDAAAGPDAAPAPPALGPHHLWFRPNHHSHKPKSSTSVCRICR